MTMNEWITKGETLELGVSEGPWHASEPETWDDILQSAVVVNGSPITWDDHSGEVFTPEDAQWIAWTRNEMPKAVKAFKAVLKIHAPAELPDEIGGLECEGCSTYDDWATWPCATVKAIEETLGEE